MAFKMELGKREEYYCANGCTFPAVLKQPFLGNRAKYCTECGSRLEKISIPYESFYCSSCNSPVNNEWKHCPYCSTAAKEDKD